MLHAMVARKKETDFNEYFDFLWEHAQSQEMSKGQFMKVSGLSPQRFSEFSQQTRNITGEYFLKMLGGVGLTAEELQKLSGKAFSEEQMIQLKFEDFVRSQKVFIEELMKDPLKLQACKTVVQLKGLWSNRYIKRIYSRLTNLRKPGQSAISSELE